MDKVQRLPLTHVMISLLLNIAGCESALKDSLVLCSRLFEKQFLAF